MGVRKVEGIVPMQERLAASDISRYKIVRKNWFAYNPMRLNIGSIARWHGDTDVLVSPDYVVFRCLAESDESALSADYLDHFRHSDQWNAFVTEAGDGSVRVRIYYDDISQLRLSLPEIAEQTKIADCLGSLDDLIGAEGRKLEALRQHKQALMQQLFPQEGETVPPLRFPQFQNAPEWRVKSIDEFACTTTGKRDTQDKVDGGNYPFFVRSQSPERIDSYAYDGEAVLTSGDGVGVGNNFHYINGKFNFHQRVYCINDFQSHALGRFFYFYFSEFFGPRVRRMSAKNSVDSVRRSMITDMPVPLPDLAEQKTIAECLSTLDTLIDAQVAKLGTLRTHKQGLLQRLFPSMVGP